MQMKPGVSILGIKPELLFGLILAESVFGVFDEELVVTSVVDGVHGTFSYHPGGYAADVRLPVVADPSQLRQRLAASLGPAFDVVLEDTHIHIEFELLRSKFSVS